MDEIWRRDLHQRPSSRSLVGSDLLIVPERRSRLSRLAPATGLASWTVPVPHGSVWLACAGDAVFWLDQSTRAQCHDRVTGAVRWTADLRGTWGWLVPAASVILAGGWRGYTPVVALDASSGQVAWQKHLGGRRIAEPVVGPWGIALAFLDEPLMTFLDPSNGAALGRVEMPDHGRDPDASPLLRGVGERLMVAGADGRYHVLDRPWRAWHTLFHHPHPITTIAPPVVGDLVLFTDGAGRLCCRDLLDGALRWCAPWQHGRRDLLPVAISGEGLVAAGSATGRLGVFGPDGEALWSKAVAKRIETNIVWTDDHTLVAGTTGALVAFRSR